MVLDRYLDRREGRVSCEDREELYNIYSRIEEEVKEDIVEREFKEIVDREVKEVVDREVTEVVDGEVTEVGVDVKREIEAERVSV